MVDKFLCILLLCVQNSKKRHARKRKNKKWSYIERRREDEDNGLLLCPFRYSEDHSAESITKRKSTQRIKREMLSSSISITGKKVHTQSIKEHYWKDEACLLPRIYLWSFSVACGPFLGEMEQAVANYCPRILT